MSDRQGVCWFAALGTCRCPTNVAISGTVDVTSTKLTPVKTVKCIVFQLPETMASDSAVVRRVDEIITCPIEDIITCPICFEDFDSPRALPCLHTFCLSCLQGHYKDKSPSDTAQCPLCREEFTIPENGLDDLRVNFHLQGLVDSKHAKPRTESCEVCSTDEEFVHATVFCVDCSERLCDRCSLPCKRRKVRPHHVRTLGDEPCRESTEDVQDDVEALKIRGIVEFVFTISCVMTLAELLMGL